MVVLITPAEKKGGILQFSYTMLRTLIELDEKVVLFIPSCVMVTDTDIEQYLVRYEKVKTINNKHKQLINIAEEIINYNPDIVIGLEDALIIQQLSWILSIKNVKMSVVIHDVIAHPYFKMSKREMMVEFLRRNYMRKTIRKSHSIIVLSDNSVNEFCKRYPKAVGKIQKLILGAHVPVVNLKELKELKGEKNYFLFFGRIDKYKGIDRLVEAFNNSAISNKLVIAGKGTLLPDTLRLINNNKNIIFINRFIEDEEMVYLYRNCKCVVLPYIEASQSGVLPIAYHFCKPVIISNLPGLLENVIENKTGLIFKDTLGLEKAIVSMVSLDYSDNIKEYYNERFSWKKNVRILLNTLLEVGNREV